MKSQIDRKLLFIITVLLASIVLPASSLLARPGNGQSHPAGIQEESGLENGVLNFIHGNSSVVINDLIFTVDKRTRFYSVSGSPVSLNSFNEDQNVEFAASDERVLKEMRKVKGTQTVESGSRSSDEGRPSSSDNGVLRLENGVWKN